MAVKRTIHEKCPRCGNRNARRIGSTIYVLGHDCPATPPGPARGFPFEGPLSEYIWEPGEFDAAFLRDELEAAWLEIRRLRSCSWGAVNKAQAAVKAAITEAFRNDRSLA